MMEKIECHWCGCEMTPTVIGHFDDGSTFINVFCTSFCEMESLTDVRFRKRSILKAIFTEAMCDAYLSLTSNQLLNNQILSVTFCTALSLSSTKVKATDIYISVMNIEKKEG